MASAAAARAWRGWATLCVVWCGARGLGWVPRSVGVADRAGEEEEEGGLPSGSGVAGWVWLLLAFASLSASAPLSSAVLPLYGRFRPVRGCDAAAILTRISTLNQSMARRILLLLMINTRTLLFVKKMKV